MKRIVVFLIVAVLVAACLAPTAFAAGAQVNVSSASAKPGQTFTVTVSISGNEDSGFSSYAIKLDFDSSALQLQSVSAGTMSQGMMFVPNTNSSSSKYGTVSGVGTTNVTGDGDLFTATFLVLDGASDNYTVTANVINFKDAANSNLSVAGGVGTVNVIHVHTLVHVSEVPATCTTAGVKDHYKCSGCGKLFSDAEGKNEVNLESLNINALGHTWDEGKVTVDPTCTEKGVMTYTCIVCGETKTEDINANGHTYEWVVTKESTCTEPGIESYKCSVCGDVADTRELPLAPHQFGDPVVNKEPTCTEAGWEIGTCVVCGATTGQEIAPLGHDWGDWSVTKDPTCTEEGEETRICKNDNSHIDTRPINALGHTWDAGVVTTDPTCTEKGVITYTCTVCGETKTGEVSALGHDYVWEYDEDGHWQVCTFGDDITEKSEHIMKLVEIEPSTTTTKGKGQYFCEDCGYEGEIVELDLLPADLDDVPKTGDITGQVILFNLSAVALIAGAVYVFKRKIVK